MGQRINLSSTELYTTCSHVITCGTVPYIVGHPGIGKSDIVRKVAKNKNLKLLDIRLSTIDPTELTGFPTKIEGNKASYIPFEMFPIEGDELPENHDGWLIFLDELSSAPRFVQAAAYKIILDRMVGLKPLHEKVHIVAAGNLITSNAVVETMSTALQSRLITLYLEPNLNDWLDWAYENKIDYRITGYLNFKKSAFHNFDPNHTESSFACPRTWEMLSKNINSFKKIPQEFLAVITGTIGEGEGIEFKTFCEVFDNLPSMSEILSNPTGFSFENSPQIRFAIAMMIAENFNASNEDKLIAALKHLGKEFAAVALKKIIKSNPTEIITLPHLSELLVETCKSIYG